MQDWLAAQAYATPEGIALIAEGEHWTYRTLHQRVGQLAGALHRQGVRPGDLVGTLLPNSAAYVFLTHALARLKAVLIPLNTRLTAAELGYQLRATNAQYLIFAESYREISTGLGDLVTLCALDDLMRMDAVPIMEGTVDLDALQAIVFTSGTTGYPKGASITFGNQFWSALGSAYRIGTLPDDRWLCCLPLFHIGGLAILMRCCLYGTAVVLQNGFEVEAVTTAIRQHQVSLISLVPTMVYRMLKQPEAASALSQVRLVLIGGAATSADLLERCAALKIKASPTYGLSEACSQVVTMLPEEARRKPNSVGKPLLFSRVEIVDQNDQPVPPNTYGEVVVSGKTIMAGYYDDLQATDRVLREGKLHTGDIGYLDEDGDLFLVQRRSDLIVSGGENVYPAEVEGALCAHPAVEAACVVGIPDPEWGQRVGALVVLKPDADLSEADLLGFARQRLAGYKQPRVLHFVPALPMTASGKIQRRLAAEWLKDHAHDQG